MKKDNALVSEWLLIEKRETLIVLQGYTEKSVE